jgi:hypothetical protein
MSFYWLHSNDTAAEYDFVLLIYTDDDDDDDDDIHNNVWCDCEISVVLSIITHIQTFRSRYIALFFQFFY